MTIIIPEDESINEIVVDVRDILAGAELEFNADKEFGKIFNENSEEMITPLVSEFVFTIQKTEFDFDLTEESFVQNIKKVKNSIKHILLNVLEHKYCKMKRLFNNGSYKKRYLDNEFVRKYIKHIKEVYNNILDSENYQMKLLREGEEFILGERFLRSSVKLVGITIVDSSEELGLETPNVKNIKITDLGSCHEKLLEKTIVGLVKDKTSHVRFNKYIKEKLIKKEEVLER